MNIWHWRSTVGADVGYLDRLADSYEHHHVQDPLTWSLWQSALRSKEHVDWELFPIWELWHVKKWWNTHELTHISFFLTPDPSKSRSCNILALAGTPKRRLWGIGTPHTSIWTSLRTQRWWYWWSIWFLAFFLIYDKNFFNIKPFFWFRVFVRAFFFVSWFFNLIWGLNLWLQ